SPTSPPASPRARSTISPSPGSTTVATREVDEGFWPERTLLACNDDDSVVALAGNARDPGSLSETELNSHVCDLRRCPPIRVYNRITAGQGRGFVSEGELG